MIHPPYTTEESRNRETFLALMWSLSYPGRIYHMPVSDNSMVLIGNALLDLETSYYTPETSLNRHLVSTGAQGMPAETASYHFYPVLTDQHLQTLARASIGSMLYPDSSAMLIIGCKLHKDVIRILQGPGIPEQHAVQIGGIPDGFWELREKACQFPLGWDVYFVDGNQVIGLPRSTQVRMI
jgi:alpha-D-ribose 1-methylphosphonate 5-triphosphate synthase subunit PhnH